MRKRTPLKPPTAEELAGISSDLSKLADEVVDACNGDPQSLRELMGFVNRLLDFWLDHANGRDHRGNPQLSRKRPGYAVIATAWSLGRWPGVSLRSLSARIGMSAPSLSTPSAEFGRRFGVRNTEFVGHDWRSKKTL